MEQKKGMSKGMKIGCAVIGGLALISILVCGGIMVWGGTYMSDMVSDLEEMGPEIRAEAERVAANGPNACVTTGLEKSTGCAQFDVKCHGVTGAFGQMCLRASNPSPAFCARVPAQTDFLEAAEWAQAECEQRGYGADQRCTSFMTNTVAAFCSRPR